MQRADAAVRRSVDNQNCRAAGMNRRAPSRKRPSTPMVFEN